MNSLDPELKRLLRWARPAESDPTPPTVPWGFHTRLAARRPLPGSASTNPAPGIPWSVVGLSYAVIVVGCLWLAWGGSVLGTAPGLPSGMAVLAQHFAP
jgi:hypothetical protein